MRKGQSQRSHEHSSHQVHHEYVAHLTIAAAGNAGGVVQGAQDENILLQVRDDLLLVPDMASGGNDRHAVAEKLLGGLYGKPEATSRVLSIGHHQIDGVFAAEVGKEPLHCLTARTADDVADEQDMHTASLFPRL